MAIKKDFITEILDDRQYAMTLRQFLVMHRQLYTENMDINTNASYPFKAFEQ